MVLTCVAQDLEMFPEDNEESDDPVDDLNAVGSWAHHAIPALKMPQQWHLWWSGSMVWVWPVWLQPRTVLTIAAPLHSLDPLNYVG